MAIGALLFGATLVSFRGLYGLALDFGDNTAYLEVAAAIRHWDFRGVQVQHFMGYPYAIALVALVLHIPLSFSLRLVAGVSSILSTLLVARLFGTGVGAYFAFSNVAWLQASFLGCSEFLAVALGMG